MTQQTIHNLHIVFWMMVAQEVITLFLEWMLYLLSSIGIEESRKVSDKHMMSISLTFLYPYMRDNLVSFMSS